MALADNIKYLRALSDLSQPEFGKMFGVTDKAVSTWENGSRIPRMGVIQKIADHYKVKTSDIIDGDIAQILSDSSRKRSDAEFTKKYRALDEHGKKLVDAVLSIEYERIAGAQHRLRVVAAENGQRAFFEERDELPPLLPEDPPDV